MTKRRDKSRLNTRWVMCRYGEKSVGIKESLYKRGAPGKMLRRCLSMIHGDLTP